MADIKIKVCGMKYPSNIAELCKLDINYIGLNFYNKSPRFIKEQKKYISALIPENIKIVGVFVNPDIDYLNEIFNLWELDFVQLHGDETVEIVKEINNKEIPVIKAFNVDENFDFRIIEKYEPFCKYFLFDTHSPAFGGSGQKFNWELLAKCDKTKLPFFLSGGIDVNDADKIKAIIKKGIKIFGVDINSRFETKPAMKDIYMISRFIDKLKSE